MEPEPPVQEPAAEAMPVAAGQAPQGPDMALGGPQGGAQGQGAATKGAITNLAEGFMQEVRLCGLPELEDEGPAPPLGPSSAVAQAMEIDEPISKARMKAWRAHKCLYVAPEPRPFASCHSCH